MMTCYDDAMRTIIELPDDQLEGLAAICRKHGISRAEAIRRAVARHIEAEAGESATRAFGLWKDRDTDGLAFQRQLRGEWQSE